MPSELFKLLDYGFAIFVGVSLLLLAIWTIRSLITQMRVQAGAINTIMTNHLPHLHEACTQMGDKVDALHVSTSEGFERVVKALDKGLDRQYDLMTKVLETKCPFAAKNKES